MGKISELELAIKDLRSTAATINEVANILAEIDTKLQAEFKPSLGTLLSKNDLIN